MRADSYDGEVDKGALLDRRGSEVDAVGSLQAAGDAAAAKKKEEQAKKDQTLLIVFLLMVLVGGANSILRVLQLVPMKNYALFSNLLTTFVYIPASALWVVPMLPYWRRENPEMLAVSQKNYIVLGALDSLAGIMQQLAIAQISNGSLPTLLLQSAIPFSMVISRMILGTKYKISQYVGAFVVVCGLLVVLIPNFSGAGNSGGGSDQAIWCIVLCLSCIPMSLSSVYKEVNLDEVDMDAIWLNLFVAIYQFIASLILIYPSGMSEGVPAKDIWQNVWGGMRCLAGRNTAADDDCSSAPLFVSLYCIANLAYNVLIIMIIKYGSSNLLWLSMTITVPVGALFFGIPGVPDFAPLTWEVIVGLVVILSGLIVYRFWPAASRLLKRAGLLPACMDGPEPAPKAPAGAAGGLEDQLLVGGEFEDGAMTPGSVMRTPNLGAGRHLGTRKHQRGSNA